MNSDESTLFDAMAMKGIETLTVRDLTQRIDQAIRRSFSGEIWIRGEIRNLSRANSGIVYFSLVEPKPAAADTESPAIQRLRASSGATPKHTIQVVMFTDVRQRVNRILTRQGAGRMEDGVEIRIRASVEFYAAGGSLQLRMTSIDPEYTLGRLAADRSAVLKRLSTEGLIDANGLLELALVPLRIALITSAGSAAEADFNDELAQSGYRFDVQRFDSRVQGDAAAESLVRAIEAAQRTDADLIVLIRGGGSALDLSTFDNEGLARAIATCPKPVVAGIGHETDRSIADDVAHTTLKTPTACASFLVDRVRVFEQRLDLVGRHIAALALHHPEAHALRVTELAHRASQVATQRLRQARDRAQANARAVQRNTQHRLAAADIHLDRSEAAVGPRSQSALRHASRQLANRQSRLHAAAPRALRSQERDLINWQARVRALDPVQTLRRGFSITTDANGNVVRSVDQRAEELITRLADGEIHSTVTDRTLRSTVADEEAAQRSAGERS